MRASLFCFGLGYSAEALARRWLERGWEVVGTARDASRLAELEAMDIEAIAFDRSRPLPADALEDATHLLISVPPDAEGDPVLDMAETQIKAALPSLRWIGYLSTTGVYGDHGGGWVDETTPPAPAAERSRRRAAAEAAWLDYGRGHGIATHIFRLAGIYGPGRSVLDDIRAGTAQCIDRPGHWFSRIHVADIAGLLRAAIDYRGAERIFNVCDDEPAASADVVRYGCSLLGVPPPPPIPFERAVLSELALSFWADNKRVRNDRIKTEFGYRLLFPSYREGLRALTNASAGP